MPRPTRRRPKSVEAEGDEALAQAVRDALGHWLRRELPPSVPNGLRELMPASLGGEFGLAGGCDDDELVFPATLTAKQRRTIHLVATELSVPHGSRDMPSGEGRACVLSRSGEFRGGEPTRSFKRATAEMDDDAPPGGFYDGAAGRELRRWCADHEDDATLGLGVEKLALRALANAPESFVALHASWSSELVGEDRAPLRLPVGDDFSAWPTVGAAPCELVTDDAGFDAMLARLNDRTRTRALGLDVEFDEQRSYLGRTCVLQLSTGDRDWVVDALACWDRMRDLRPVMADPSVLKVGQAIGMADARALSRDFGIAIVGSFDTFEASNMLDEPHKSLAALLRARRASGERAADAVADDDDELSRLKKRYQVSAWYRRPFTEGMLRYAAWDVRYLLPLAANLWERLARDAGDDAVLAGAPDDEEPADVWAGFGEPVSEAPRDGGATLAPAASDTERLAELVRRSARACSRFYSGKREKDPKSSGDYRRAAASRGWGTREDAAFFSAWAWRERVCAALDEGHASVCPDWLLTNIARRRPCEPSELARLTTPLPAVFGSRGDSSESAALLEEVRAAVVVHDRARAEETAFGATIAKAEAEWAAAAAAARDEAPEPESQEAALRIGAVTGAALLAAAFALGHLLGSRRR